MVEGAGELRVSFMRAPVTQSPWGTTSPVTLGGKSKQIWGNTNLQTTAHTNPHGRCEAVLWGQSHLIER